MLEGAELTENVYSLLLNMLNEDVTETLTDVVHPYKSYAQPVAFKT